MTVTHSLAEVAADYLPPEWTDGVRWLSRRLNRGEISGYRVGRVWRMRDSDIEAMLDKFSNQAVAEQVPVVQGDELDLGGHAVHCWTVGTLTPPAAECVMTTAAGCFLPHHNPGSWVAWHQWDNTVGRMQHFTGRVISHTRRRLTIAVDPDGRRHETECGHVTKAAR